MSGMLAGNVNGYKVVRLSETKQLSVLARRWQNCEGGGDDFGIDASAADNACLTRFPEEVDGPLSSTAAIR